MGEAPLVCGGPACRRAGNRGKLRTPRIGVPFASPTARIQAQKLQTVPSHRQRSYLCHILPHVVGRLFHLSCQPDLGREDILDACELLHAALDLHFPVLAALRTEKMGPCAPDVDEHGAPARVLKAALRTLLSVVDMVAVLAEKDGPLPGHRPPHPRPTRCDRVRTGLLLRGLGCGGGKSKWNRGNVLGGCLWHFFRRSRRWIYRDDARGADGRCWR